MAASPQLSRLQALGALVVLMTQMVASQVPASDPARQLREFFASEWDWTMKHNPTWASRLGDRRWNDRWEDLSIENIERQYQHRREALATLRQVPRDALPEADRVSYDIFRYQYQTDLEGYPFEQFLLRTDTFGGVQNSENLVPALRFATVRDYEDWIARLHAFPRYLDQNTALMRRGISHNILLPRIIVERVAGQVVQLATQAVESSGYYHPFLEFPASVSEADRQRLTREGRTAVVEQVQPAFAAFKTFIDREYLPASYLQVGVWQNARGADAYGWLVRFYTTTGMTPDEVHALGLSEVARIQGEMERVKATTGFTGALPAFFTYLRTDPRFFYKTGPELLQAYRALAKRVDPELVRVLKTTPRSPYGVIPIPASIAPNVTTAYAEYGAADGSRPAYYCVNLYKPETRPTWEMMALTLHEAVPGHCLQGAISQELTDLPEFRKHAGFTAYVEGWALYAESLGDEMGLYDDPYAKFGQLTYEMWRAVRLVVDTGMHAKRWTRDQAIRYFMEHAAKTEFDVTNEVDRYSSWPCQALAYKVGDLRIKEMRRRASARLGAKFDLREFNDLLLSAGPMPLDLLDRRVDEWTAYQ
jgi:uncharacterized protein (DUF885 family)